MQMRRTQSPPRQPTGRPVARLRGGAALQQYLIEMENCPELTAEMERRLGERIEQGDQEAFHQLVVAHLPLVVVIVSQYAWFGEEWLLDLIQEGNIGLMRAARRFDVRRGARFAAYAPWEIRKEISGAVASLSRTIRLPLHVVRDIYKIVRAGQDGNATGPTGGLSPEELSRRTGLSVARVVELQLHASGTASLDAPLGIDERTCLRDVLQGLSSSMPEAEVVHREELAHLHQALRCLLPMERQAVVLRVCGGLRWGEIAQACQRSDRMMRHYYRSALDKLRSALEQE
jgi:RNA polymerase primary sigma factor